MQFVVALGVFCIGIGIVVIARLRVRRQQVRLRNASEVDYALDDAIALLATAIIAAAAGLAAEALAAL